MSEDENALLIYQAERLITLGRQVEAARAELKQLVEQGVPYTSSEMLAAYRCFETLDSEWKRQEKEHLELYGKI